MFLKNSWRRASGSLRFVPSLSIRWPTHSLRLRLMIWYGGLMALGLGCFGLLILLLASTSINNSNKSAVSAETRVANVDLTRALKSRTPFWPSDLDQEMPDIYNSPPGIIVQVFDAQSKQILYNSGKDNVLSLSDSLLQQLDHGTTTTWYSTSMSSNQVLVEVSAIYAPSSNISAGRLSTEHPVNIRAQLIGVLLVAKSLHDSSMTMMSLQELLLLTGAIMLIIFVGCGWAVIGYALRPLSDLVNTASSIAAETARGKRVGNLSQRVKRPEEDSEMVKVIDAFNDMLTSIEDSTTVQRRFIADASHELRAPLTTIQGNLAFLIRYIEDIPPVERHTMLADAHGETLRLSSLVDELLLLARADANMGQTAITERSEPIVELDRTLLNLVRQMRRSLEIERSDRKIEIGRIEPVRVRGDEESMRRVMVILLENAIKYTDTEKDKVQGKVTVALELAGKEAILQVCDTGIGIEAQDLPHIFERFYRADQARSRQGTGLGLAIAQTLVYQQGGKITAESTPGEGSTFRVFLPLA
jgi:two-component system OmpR family sensor kinase